MIILLLGLIAGIIFLTYKLISSSDKNFSFSLIITAICSLFIIELIISPSLCINSSIYGAKLFFYKVFPSLYTFMVICNLIINYNGISIYTKFFGNILCFPLRLPKQCSFALIVSMLCGYPLGAKYSITLYEKKLIDINTCQRLLNIATNVSPLFAIGAIGTSMLHNTSMGYILIISSYISCFAMSILIPSKKNTPNIKLQNKNEFKKFNFGEALKESIESSLKTCLSIAGFIILFSVIITLLNNILFVYIKNNSIKGGFLGMIELTKGCSLISLTSINIKYKLGILSFLLSFSGLSIISQVYSFTYKYKISMLKYTLLKFIQGIFSSIITMTIYNIFLSSNDYVSVFNSYNSNNSSHFLFFLIIPIIMVIPLILNKLKKFT